MIEYSDRLRYAILKVLENDIDRMSKQYRIYNFDREDVAQELRLFVWTYSRLYNPHKASIRTWGVRTLRSGIINLFNAQHNTDRRKANVLRVEFDDSKDHEEEN